MNKQTFALSRSNPMVKRILVASFPDYQGRKIKAVIWDQPLHLQLFWAEGSRDQVVLIDWEREQIGRLNCPSPWANGACDPLEIPPQAILVVHSISVGRDVGITFYLRGEAPLSLLELAAGS